MQQDATNNDPGVDICKAIVEQTPEAIIFSDREGAIRLWNVGAEFMFGHMAADVMGKSLDVIIPERLQRAHWDGFNRAMETGVAKYVHKVLTTRSMHKNGTKLYVDLSFVLLRDRGGQVVGALAVGRDCTSRQASDSALRARVAELEKDVAQNAKGAQ